MSEILAPTPISLEGIPNLVQDHLKRLHREWDKVSACGEHARAAERIVAIFSGLVFSTFCDPIRALSPTTDAKGKL